MTANPNKKAVDVSSAEKRVSGITFRSALISLISMFVLARIAHLTYTGVAPDLGITEPGLAFVVVFLILGAALSRFSKVLGFTKAELLVIYVATGVGGLYYSIFATMITVMQSAYSNLTNATAFSSVYGELSEWIVPTGSRVIRAFWLGRAKEVPWSDWVKPMIAWFVPLFCLYFIGICIAVLFRKKWDEQEHLPFPIAQATHSILSGTYGVDNSISPELNRRMFFLGGIVPLVLIGSNILNAIWPMIPTISRELPVFELFPEGNPMRHGLQGWPTLYFRIEPISLGLLYLVPLDIAFSAWFFWIFTKLTHVYAYSKGFWDNGIEFMTFHPVGAYVGLGAYLFWLNKDVFNHLMTDSLRTSQITDDSPMSPRAAALGLLAAMVVFCLFFTVLLHVKVWVTLVYLLIVVLSVTAFARLRAEAAVGPARAHHLPDVFKQLFGSQRVGQKSLGGIGLLYGQSGMGGVAANCLEGWRLADQLKTRKRDITIVLMVGFVLVYVLTFRMMLPTAYEMGAGMFHWYPRQLAVQGTEQLLTRDVEASRVAGLSVVLGAIITFGLMFLRTRFLRWPFHPVGYALGWQYDVGFWFWSSFFLAWIIKLLVLRYGGNKLHKIVLPFMYGMIVCGMVLQGIQYLVTVIL